ncbi:MAG: hypothetical protein CSA49_02070 [Gammaproteobacteria bacterium]|nr:MAG: hypothetical protein CSA49_02070 [Gammaproteobacteria bacterium]
MRRVMTSFQHFITATVSAIILSLAAVVAHGGETSSSHIPGIQEKRIMGWVEYIYIGDSQTKLKAKLDTGAKTSSIHARNIEHFQKNGQPWVRFDLSRKSRKAYIDKYGHAHPHKPAISLTLERPLVRTTKIKSHKSQSMLRPVITLPVYLGGRQYEPEFTLTDRHKFIYPVLLGRRFLKNVAVVDASKTFITHDTPSRGAAKSGKIATTKSPQPEKQRP